jgi:hypothetical protein
MTHHSGPECDCKDDYTWCLAQQVHALAKARDALASLATILADGDHPPSAVEVRRLIGRLSKVGKP